MTDSRDRRLLRLLAGECGQDERREIESELAADPALRARFARLEATWNGIELPEEDPVPASFTDSVVAGVGRGAPYAVMPTGPLRWAAVAAAGVGLALGMFLGSEIRRAPRGAVAATVTEDSWEATPSLATDYWEALEEALPGGEEPLAEPGDSDSESA